jgi:excisionase family DNA binding protein
MTKTEGTSSRLDTVPGPQEEQDKKWESESLHVTIQQAARRCGVSDKTIQRAIRAGTLPARYPQSNRCEIAISDLDTFLPGHVQTATKRHLTEQVSGHVQAEMQQRVAALEQRVGQLEHLVAQLLDGPVAPKRQSRAKARERTTGPLPRQFVSLLVFAERHCVAEAKVQTHTEMGLLPVNRGEWTDTGGMVVTLALDARGRHAFYRLYHGVPPFLECDLCPHVYQDSVSGHG